MPISALNALDADVSEALEHINIPSYVIDSAGVIRWVNPCGVRKLDLPASHRIPSRI